MIPFSFRDRWRLVLAFVAAWYVALAVAVVSRPHSVHASTDTELQR